MSDTVIKVENLSKRYFLSHLADKREQLFSRLLVNKTKSLLSLGKKVVTSPFTIHDSPFTPLTPFTNSQEEFWALNDVSFEIHQGDRVGIIGRNGAGKSTLLKILSRITEPTKGRITIDGRVASLLEVGTGFHSELTGRENIYLNGAILGMGREEIKRKFDEIVAFAEVEKFLDTPVKRYSSGMYVRLAFAVAAHLEPEILIVDEVLAVGDAQFQKKCLGKMEDVSTKEGRTVLFVSHNMSAVRQLCSKGFILDGGTLIYAGTANDAADSYLKNAVGKLELYCGERTFPNNESKEFQVTAARLKNNKDDISDSFECNETIIIEVECISRRPVPGLYGYLGILNREGQEVWVSDSFDMPPNRFDAILPGTYTLKLTIPPWTLAHGEYVILLSFASQQSSAGFFVDCPGETLFFSLNDSSTLRGNSRGGYLSTLLPWVVEPTAHKAIT
jgi:lipopolysaccharide transport system ATP-binding protein